MSDAAIGGAPPGGRNFSYPGWRVVAMSFVIFFFAFGAPMTMPMVYQEVMKEFGWTLTQATLIHVYKSVTGAVIALFLIGPLIDRFGLKTILLCAMAAEAMGMASFLFVSSMWSYYTVGFMIGIGQGAVLICVKLLVSRWFMRNVGLAGAIAIIGSSVGGMVFPLVAAYLIPHAGWRVAFACLSLGVFFVSMPLALIARANPSELEVLPEALPTSPRQDGVEALRAAELDFSYATVLRQPAFWCIAAGTILSSGVDQALFHHTIFYLTGEAGLSRNIAASALSVTFVMGIVAKFMAGILFDKLSMKGISLWNVLLAIAVLLAFPVQGLATAMIFGCARGFAHGGLVVDSPVIAKHVYGPRYMNRLMPVFAGFSTVGSAMGPVGLAMIYDYTGGYRIGFMLFIGLALAAALLMWQVRPLYRDRLRASLAVA